MAGMKSVGEWGIGRRDRNVRWTMLALYEAETPCWLDLTCAPSPVFVSLLA